MTIISTWPSARTRSTNFFIDSCTYTCTFQALAKCDAQDEPSACYRQRQDRRTGVHGQHANRPHLLHQRVLVCNDTLLLAAGIDLWCEPFASICDHLGYQLPCLANPETAREDVSRRPMHVYARAQACAHESWTHAAWCCAQMHIASILKAVIYLVSGGRRHMSNRWR